MVLQTLDISETWASVAADWRFLFNIQLTAGQVLTINWFKLNGRSVSNIHMVCGAAKGAAFTNVGGVFTALLAVGADISGASAALHNLHSCRKVAPTITGFPYTAGADTFQIGIGIDTSALVAKTNTARWHAELDYTIV